ncbi:MAG TPA: ammonium transporter [Polyangiaceae bacterium]|nr:ammonium transporter [Polyangiaceae bacterium]
MKKTIVVVLAMVCSLLFMGQAWAQTPPAEAAPAAAAAVEAAPAAAPPAPTLESLAADLKTRSTEVDTVWVLVTAFLVFWMQAGFALVETGLTRAKNTVNILMKNMMDFCFATIGFWFIGFGVMFGAGTDWFGTSGFMLHDAGKTFDSLSWTPVGIDCKFFFQLVFAGTAATIVSGAMAERTKFTSYLIYSLVISLIIYPVSGHWIWGGGALSAGHLFGAKGMFDFAGSTVVHSVGGWIALCGAVVLGPRIGKYNKDGTANSIPGHNFGQMMLGVFILWLGWFGFNPGSTMMATGMGDTIAHISVTTNAAAATGTVFALVTAKWMFGKWDAGMAGNGCLAGLVAITAPCAFVDTWAALLIGAIGGVLVVASCVFFEKKLKIDDPVGATSVHLTNGIWGTLAVGLFSNPVYGATGPEPGLFFGGGFTQLGIQAAGIVVVGVWCLVTGFALFYALKAVTGLRVSAKEELAGLDGEEHGMAGYPDFMLRPEPTSSIDVVESEAIAVKGEPISGAV